MSRAQLIPLPAVRARDLLTREIEVSERIVARIQPGDPRGADYLLRLAETYEELERAWSSRRDEPGAAEQASRAQDQAIRTYARIVEGYPAYARMDELLYRLAANLDAIGRREQGRQVHMRLIKGHPESELVPASWLSFGDFYFDDGDFEAARQFYAKTLEYSPERNRYAAYARYRLAWSLHRLGEHREALVQFVGTLAVVNEPGAQQHGSEQLGRAALLEMSVPYVQVGRPQQAEMFFSRHAPSTQDADDALIVLTTVYMGAGRFGDAADLAGSQLARATGGEACAWLQRYESARACHSGGASRDGVAPGGGGSIDDLLEGARVHSAPAGAGAAATDAPSRGDVVSAMQGVSGAVSACGNGEHGTALVAVTVSGATGQVIVANVSGQFAGPPVGTCIARAVRGASFPRFTRPTFTFNYPFRL